MQELLPLPLRYCTFLREGTPLLPKVVCCRVAELDRLAANPINRYHHWHQGKDRTVFQDPRQRPQLEAGTVVQICID